MRRGIPGCSRLSMVVPIMKKKKRPLPVIGYDIGGTKIAVCVADAGGRVLASQRIATGMTRGYDEVLAEMVAVGKHLVREAGYKPKDLVACGISAPGPLDIRNGLMLKTPNMVWDSVPVRDDLQRHLGLPTFLDNDANAGVLAEWLFGAAQGLRNVVYLTMSTGVGGGVIAEGQLVQGTNGNAGELGHVILDVQGLPCGCGMRGCLEAYCGGRNVARRLQALLRDRPDHAMMRLPEVRGKLENLGYPALRAGVRAEIPLALEVWEEICLRLAQGLGIYLMSFNPEMIVLGTVAYYSGDLLLDPVRRHLPRFAWPEMRGPCRIAVAALGEKLGEMAGVSVALYGLHQRGEWELPAAR